MDITLDECINLGGKVAKGVCTIARGDGDIVKRQIISKYGPAPKSTFSPTNLEIAQGLGYMALLGIAFFLFGIFIYSCLVFLIWNYVLTFVFGLQPINFFWAVVIVMAYYILIYGIYRHIFKKFSKELHSMIPQRA
jgi:hypothetical protein